MGQAAELRLRPIWRQIVLVVILVMAWRTVGLAFRSIRGGRIGSAISLKVDFEGPAQRENLKLIRVRHRVQQGPLPAEEARERSLLWNLDGECVTSLLLAGRAEVLDKVETVTVRVGDEVRTFGQEALREQCPLWRDGSQVPLLDGAEVRCITAAFPGAGSVLRRCRGLLNYPGDVAVLVSALGEAAREPPLWPLLALCAAVIVAQFCVPRSACGVAFLEACVPAGSTDAAAGESQPEEGGAKKAATWWVAGFVVLIGSGILLEVQQPYYFTQDDNYAQFLPSILQGCRSVSLGHAPAWNPHQFLGAPAAEVGTYALTYPFTYVSYAVATYVLGNEYATIEVFCWFHLVAGFAAAFWFARSLGVCPELSAGLAICLMLSGYALIAGRSWYYMTPVFLWSPLLGVAIARLQTRDPGWRWTLGTALVIGLFFHAGNAQMWAYGVGFFCLALAWNGVTGTMPRSRIVKAMPAIILGIGVAVPLLVPQLLAMKDLERVGGYGRGIGRGVFAVFLPYPLVRAPHPQGCGTSDLQLMGQFYYAGTLLSLAWLARLIGAWMRRGGLLSLMRDWLFVLGLVALILCLGSSACLWTLQSKLPGLDKFTYPFKFLPFFHLFSLASGAVLVHRIIVRSPRRKWWASLCFFAVCGLVVYHVSLARPSFYSYADRPYPEMPERLAEVLSGNPEPVRILPIAPVRSVAPGYTLGLAHNLPSVYGVDSLGGYDPLVEQRPQYQGVARRLEEDFAGAVGAYGVTHLLIHRLSREPVLSGNPAFLQRETDSLYPQEEVRAYCVGKDVVAETADVRVVKVDGSAPRSFPLDAPTHRLPVAQAGSQIAVDVSGVSEDGTVVVNYLWYPGIEVSADGRVVPSSPDEFGRIQARVPGNTRTLTVLYRSSWGLGMKVCLLLVIVGSCLQLALGKLR
ncbi:MAG: hypothetical protein HQ582_26505 [Planctomycetes bacterium]|nr:hypothetical protein [Planctomycetota bacterium]